MTESVTFQELSNALSHLGFKKTTTPQFTVFRKEEQGAMLVLPPESSSVHVLPMHLSAARETVVGKGIAGSQEFDQLLSLTGEVRNRAASRRRQPARLQISAPAAKRAKKAMHQDDKRKSGN